MADLVLVSEISYVKLRLLDDNKCEIVAMGVMKKKGKWNKVGYLEPVTDGDHEEGVCAFKFLAEKTRDHGPGADPIKATYILEDYEECDRIEVIYENGSVIRNIHLENAEWDEDEGEENPSGGKKGRPGGRGRGRKGKKGHGHGHGHGGGHGHDDDYDPWDEEPWPNPKPHKKCCCGEMCEDGEIECLLGLHVLHGHVVIRVKSNGNTKKEDFKFCVFKGCTGKRPFEIEFCRCRPDNGDCPEPYGVKLKFSFEELCLEKCDSFIIRNPICCDRKEPDVW